MGLHDQFLPYLAVWILLLAIFVWRSWYGRHGSVGLVLAYCFQLWLFYWFPSLLHYLPWTDLPDQQVTFLGFEQSTYALAAFLVGHVIAGPVFAQLRVSNRMLVFSPDPRLPGAYIASGLFSFVILSPILRHIPSVGALANIGQQIMIVGFCLAIWRAWCEGSVTKAVGSLGPLLLMPIVTVVNSGFLGSGFMTITVVFIFGAQFFRPRYLLMICCLVMGYLGLSFYVTYMRDRSEIRDTVWGGKSFENRFSKFTHMMSTFELLDLHKQAHLSSIDGRLNQGSLVGAAVLHLKDTRGFANGASIRDAMLAMIPRIIWPGKTVSAGSGDWVTRFTGITFAEGTAVGIGQVLEFYGNFGRNGVLIGFLLFGLILGTLDMTAASRLAAGDWQGFAFLFVVGVAMLNAGGSLVEVTASMMASIVLMHITNTLLAGYQKILNRLHRHDAAVVAGPLR